MPKRTLRLDIQPDDTFISRVETEIKRRWHVMNATERAVVSVLIKALNEDRQASTAELASVLKDGASLEHVVHTLRVSCLLPVMSAVGRSGGYRLPVSRVDCDLFLQSEISGIFKKIERLIAVSKAMSAFNTQGSSSRSSVDALEALYRVHQLDRSEDRPATKRIR